jgi:hypothetical protein
LRAGACYVVAAYSVLKYYGNLEWMFQATIELRKTDPKSKLLDTPGNYHIEDYFRAIGLCKHYWRSVSRGGKLTSKVSATVIPYSITEADRRGAHSQGDMDNASDNALAQLFRSQIENAAFEADEEELEDPALEHNEEGVTEEHVAEVESFTAKMPTQLKHNAVSALGHRPTP